MHHTRTILTRLLGKCISCMSYATASMHACTLPSMDDLCFVHCVRVRSCVRTRVCVPSHDTGIETHMHAHNANVLLSQTVQITAVRNTRNRQGLGSAPGRRTHLGFQPGLPGAQGEACPACALACLHPAASAAAGTSAAALGHQSPCTHLLLCDCDNNM